MHQNNEARLRMPRRKTQPTRAEELEKHVVHTLLMEAATECLDKKDANNGRLPHGCMAQVLSRIGHPKINRDSVNYQIAKLEEFRAKASPAIDTTPTTNVFDDFSELTSPSMFSNSSESSTTRAKGGRPKKVLLMNEQDEATKKQKALSNSNLKHIVVIYIECATRICQ